MCASCLSWMSFQDNGDSTATITGTPLDAHVDAGGTAITVQGVSGGETVQASYTITVTEVNDEPTLTATGATGTFTEGGLTSHFTQVLTLLTLIRRHTNLRGNCDYNHKCSG